METHAQDIDQSGGTRIGARRTFEPTACAAISTRDDIRSVRSIGVHAGASSVTADALSYIRREWRIHDLDTVG